MSSQLDKQPESIYALSTEADDIGAVLVGLHYERTPPSMALIQRVIDLRDAIRERAKSPSSLADKQWVKNMLAGQRLSVIEECAEAADQFNDPEWVSTIVAAIRELKGSASPSVAARPDWERVAAIARYEHELREQSRTTVHDEMIRLLCEWARGSDTPPAATAMPDVPTPARGLSSTIKWGEIQAAKAMPDSPTPRTDACLRNAPKHILAQPGQQILVTPAPQLLDLARQLERELAGLQAMYRAACKLVEESIPAPSASTAATAMPDSPTPRMQAAWDEMAKHADYAGDAQPVMDEGCKLERELAEAQEDARIWQATANGERAQRTAASNVPSAIASNEIPEGLGSPPAGALVSGSPSTAAPDANPGSAVPGGEDDNSPSELDIDPETHPSYAPPTTATTHSRDEETVEQMENRHRAERMATCQEHITARYVRLEVHYAELRYRLDAIARSSNRLWLWKNFVDGRPEYWAFDNPYPCVEGGGDPLTLGEPCGYAIVKPSTRGRDDVSDEQVIAAIKRSLASSATEMQIWSAVLAVVEAARWLSKTLDGGFVRCSRCGDQEDTTDTDYAPELRKALAEYDRAIDMGKS